MNARGKWPLAIFLRKGESILNRSLLIIFGLLLLQASAAAAPVDAYKANVTRSDATAQRLIYNFWSGEYPAPVIDVHASKSGVTKISAHKSLRALNEPVACTIKNGLYHPWSDTKTSVRGYYTVSNVTDYEVKRRVELDGTLQPGDRLINVFSLAEGLCKGTLQSKSRKENIQFSCDVLDDSGQFKNLAPTTDRFHEQWLYLSCNEGYAAFVRDEDLLKQPGIKAGRIASYGRIEAVGAD